MTHSIMVKLVPSIHTLYCHALCTLWDPKTCLKLTSLTEKTEILTFFLIIFAAFWIDYRANKE